MVISRLNKYLIYSIFSIILFGFACSNETENDAEINKLEYLAGMLMTRQIKETLRDR